MNITIEPKKRTYKTIFEIKIKHGQNYGILKVETVVIFYQPMDLPWRSAETPDWIEVKKIINMTRINTKPIGIQQKHFRWFGHTKRIGEHRRPSQEWMPGKRGRGLHINMFMYVFDEGCVKSTSLKDIIYLPYYSYSSITAEQSITSHT